MSYGPDKLKTPLLQTAAHRSSVTGDVLLRVTAGRLFLSLPPDVPDA